MTSINLVPQRTLYARRQRCRIRRWVSVCIVYALLLTVLSVLCQTVWARPDRSGYALQIQQADDRIAEAEQAIALLEPQLARTRLTLAIEREIVSQPDWSILLALLGRLMGQDIVLRECVLTPVRPPGQAASVGVRLVTAPDGSMRLGAHEYTLNLRGLGRSQSAVSQFVLRLEETELFHQVKLVNTMREPMAGDVDAFSFQIECTLGTAPDTTGKGKP